MQQTKVVSKKSPSKPIFAFIDSQNLNLGVKSLGWSLDWRKFRQYLRNKLGVIKAYLFIGYVPGNEGMYTNMQTMGYIVILKPTMELPNGIVKGNVDAELVLHTMIQYQNFSEAVIVSGDGDFFCLVEHLAKNHKLSRLYAPNRHYSRLYRPYSSYIVRIDQLKNSLELKSNKKTGIGVRSKP
jgi:uncharacterized LabA/DUF88 family protein